MNSNKTFVSLIIGVMVLLAAAGCATEKSRFENAKKFNSIRSYQEFLRSYPDGTHAEEARRRIQELELAKAERAAQETERKAELKAREKQEALEHSREWKATREGESMTKLLSYCFNESVTKEQVQELMGKPDKVTQGESVWTYTAKPSEPDGKRQSAIFGFDDNQRVMGARLQSSSGAVHQKVRQPSGAVEQKWIYNKN